MENKLTEQDSSMCNIQHFFDKTTYKNITLYDIYSIRDYDQYIINYWIGNKILRQKEALRRVAEVAVLMLDEHNHVIGVCTLLERIYQKEIYLYGRMHITPKSSRLYLWKKVFDFTKSSFEKKAQTNIENNPYKGIIFEVENKKFDKRVMKHYFENSGWQQEPDNNKNQTVWKYDFNLTENSNDEKKFDFSSSYTDNLPKIFEKLNISLAVTSYQTARVFFVRSDGEKIETHFKHYPRPMGIYADEHRITLGTFSQVLEFKRSDSILAQIKEGSLDSEQKFTKKVLEKDKERMEELRKHRKKEIDELKKADALYLPRASITTGMINIHDIAWGDEGLWVVNSTFSCLSTLSPDCSFVAKWKPPFISELVPEDRCHLNGMAMRDGRPKYVTTFNRFDERDSWTKENKHDGTLIDIDTNEVLLEGMIMPHSPRYYRGFVYVCESGTGQVWRYDPKTKEKRELIKLQGFTRGVNFYGGLMFVGLSKSRASEIKNPIPLNKEYEETFSGIWVVNLEDGSEVGHIKFEGDVEQIYDVAVIPDAIAPELLQGNSSLIRHIFDFKEEIV